MASFSVLQTIVNLASGFVLAENVDHSSSLMFAGIIDYSSRLAFSSITALRAVSIVRVCSSTYLHIFSTSRGLLVPWTNSRNSVFFTNFARRVVLGENYIFDAHCVIIFSAVLCNFSTRIQNVEESRTQPIASLSSCQLFHTGIDI